MDVLNYLVALIAEVLQAALFRVLLPKIPIKYAELPHRPLHQLSPKELEAVKHYVEVIRAR